MGKQRSIALDDLTATGATAGVSVKDFESLIIVVGGTFVGTYTIEGSMDGTNFAALTDTYGTSLAGLTAARAAQLPAGLTQVRVDCTAYTSGTIESDAGGIDADLKS